MNESLLGHQTRECILFQKVILKKKKKVALCIPEDLMIMILIYSKSIHRRFWSWKIITFSLALTFWPVEKNRLYVGI